MIRAYFLFGVEDLSVPYVIREEVFVKEQGFSAQTEQDEWDKRAVHVVVLDDEIPCATGRLYPDRNGVWHIGRVAVRKEKRGLHLGDLLMRMLLDQAQKMGAQTVELGAQQQAVPFYEKCGFTVCGEVYDDEGRPHLPMRTTAERIETLLHGGCNGHCADCHGCGAKPQLQ